MLRLAARLGDRFDVRLGAQFGLTRRLSSDSELGSRLGSGSARDSAGPSELRLGCAGSARFGSGIGSRPAQLDNRLVLALSLARAGEFGSVLFGAWLDSSLAVQVGARLRCTRGGGLRLIAGFEAQLDQLGSARLQAQLSSPPPSITKWCNLRYS